MENLKNKIFHSETKKSLEKLRIVHPLNYWCGSGKKVLEVKKSTLLKEEKQNQAKEAILMAVIASP